VHGAFHPPVHTGRFSYPPNFSYRHYGHGDFLPGPFLLGGFFIDDFVTLGLWAPPYGERWIRVGPDALLIDVATGQVVDAVYGVYDDGSAPPPPPPPPPGLPAPSAKLFDNWNTGACGLTDTATLDLNRPLQLDRLELWLNWGANEQTAGYSVFLNGQQLGGGTLQRAGCDPYQAAWCTATDSPADTTLAPGHFEFRVDHPALCQNAGSGNVGFIRVFGRWS
jgi:hypothetical protein